MSSNQLARLERLERIMKSNSAGAVWVDMQNNRARVDLHLKSGKVQREEEITFDTVRACADWVEARIAENENITGTAFFDDVSELFTGEQHEALQAAFVDGEERGTLINLHAARLANGLAPVAFATWLSSKRAMSGNYQYKSPCDLVTRGAEKFAILLLFADQVGAQFPALTEWDNAHIESELQHA